MQRAYQFGPRSPAFTPGGDGSRRSSNINPYSPGQVPESSMRRSSRDDGNRSPPRTRDSQHQHHPQAQFSQAPPPPPPQQQQPPSQQLSNSSYHPQQLPSSLANRPLSLLRAGNDSPYRSPVASDGVDSSRQGSDDDEIHEDHADEASAGGAKSKAGSRVNKACTPCRSRKRKCDGSQPECNVCRVLGETCNYSEASRKRGPPKGSRLAKEAAKDRLVRNLEKIMKDLVAKCGPEVSNDEIRRLMESTLGRDFSSAPPVSEASDPHTSSQDETRARKRGRTETKMEVDDVIGGVAGPENSRQSPEDDADADFLGVNERGDLMHRGSSSGIQLLTRRPGPIPGPSSLQTFQGLPSQSDAHSVSSGSSGPTTPGLSRGRTMSYGAGGPVHLPMAPPRHGSCTPRSSPSHSPERPMQGLAVTHSQSHARNATLSDGAIAHRDHILSSLSPSLSSAHRGRTLEGRRAKTPPGEASRTPTPLRSTSRASGIISPSGVQTAGGSITPLAEHLSKSFPFESDDISNVTVEQHEKLFRYYYQGVHPFWPIIYKPALETLSSEEVPQRLAPVLLYSIYAIASCVVPGTKKSGRAAAEADVADEKAGISRASRTARGSATDEDADMSSSSDTKEGQVLGKPATDGGRDSSVDTDSTPDPEMAELFFRRAEHHLHEGRLRPDVSTIQACFLLALYSHGSGELSRAWVFSNLACSMAMDLGLHRWPIHRMDLLYDSIERETRVRLIWCCYILNVVLAAEMGRPVTMRAKDCDAPLLSEAESDEYEEWAAQLEMHTGSPGEDGDEPPHRYLHVASCLNWGVRLFTIVERVLSEVHSFRRKAALRKQGKSVLVLAELDAELLKWRERLPDHLRLQSSAFRDSQGDGSLKLVGPAPSFFALHLWLATATILLHRPFIPQDQGVSLAAIMANESHKKSTAAANEICDRLLQFSASSLEVDRLSTDLAYCLFTAAVMFVFNARLPNRVMSKDARRRFALCREWLRKLSETWPAASAHKQLLDGFSTVGEDALGEEDESDVELQATGAGPSNLEVDDAAAGNWSNKPMWPSENTEQATRVPQTSPLPPNTFWWPGNSASHAVSWPPAQPAQPVRVSTSVASQPMPPQMPPPMQESAFFPNSRGRSQSGNSLQSAMNQVPQTMQATSIYNDRQRQPLIDYYAANAVHGNDTVARIQAPVSIFDIEHLYWNETASMQSGPMLPYQPVNGSAQSRRTSNGPSSNVQPQVDIPQGNTSTFSGGITPAPGLLAARTSQQLQQLQQQQQQQSASLATGSDGLSILAHVTGTNGGRPGPEHSPQIAIHMGSTSQNVNVLSSPEQQQPPQRGPAYSSVVSSSTPLQQPQANSAQATPHIPPGTAGSSLSVNASAQATPNLQAPSRHLGSSLSPFGFLLDPSTPSFGDLMSLLELPPAFSQ